MKFLLSFLTFFLVSCGSYSLYDVRGFVICKDEHDCGESIPDRFDKPYDDEKFKSILDNSKLHYPDTETEVKYGKFEGFVSPHFYAYDGKLIFQLNKKEHGKLRSELRLGPDEWEVSSPYRHILRANLRLYGSKNITKYTFVQIHGNKPFSWPLLRMTWEKQRAGKINHIWAIVMTNRDESNKTYDWYDLGERKSGFFDVEVVVYNNNLRIKVDDKVYVDKDVSYWVGLPNYYKIGLYLNDKNSTGMTKMDFTSIEYIDESK